MNASVGFNQISPAMDRMLNLASSRAERAANIFSVSNTVSLKDDCNSHESAFLESHGEHTHGKTTAEVSNAFETQV